MNAWASPRLPSCASPTSAMISARPRWSVGAPLEARSVMHADRDRLRRVADTETEAHDVQILHLEGNERRAFQAGEHPLRDLEMIEAERRGIRIEAHRIRAAERREVRE